MQWPRLLEPTFAAYSTRSIGMAEIGRPANLKRIFFGCLCLVCVTVVYVSRTDFGPLSGEGRIGPSSTHLLYPSNWTLINLKRFEFLLNSDVCQDDQPVQLLISVTSHPGHVTMRRAFRKALPSHVLEAFGMRRIFLLARIDPRQNGYEQVNQSVIEEEHLHHGDIVQGDFVESYHNLSYKHVMGLKYAVRYCHQARFVLKMDDDIVVDLFRILQLLKTSKVEGSLKIAGSLMNAEERNPLRDEKSKWYLTYDEYPWAKFPQFVSGWAYVTTIPVAERLVNCSEQSPYFWIDDVYVTGILANLSKVEFIDIRPSFTIYSHYIQCCVDQPGVLCDYLVGPTSGEQLTEDFYRHTFKCQINKCQRAPRRCKIAVKAPKPKNVIRGQVIPLTL